MNELVRLLLFPAIVLAAWLISRKRNASARKSARLMSVFLATILVCIAVTGWFRPVGEAATIHRWAGHALVLAAWLFVPFAVGVALQHHIHQRPIGAIAQVLALLLLLGLTLLASFTGYLGPSHADQLTQETRNRFHVLHLFVLPGLVAVLLAFWFWFFRPHNRKPA